jgi:predicted secreted protein
VSEPIAALVGEPFTIPLADGLGGYRWSPCAVPDGIRFLGTQPAGDESPTGEVGRAVPRRFTFVADRPGDYRIELELRRSWEEEPRRTLAVDVRASG